MLPILIPILLTAVLGAQAAPGPKPGSTGKTAAPMVLPLARGLVGRYLNAVGGRVALWDLKSFSAHATLSAGGGDASGELDLAFRKPDLMVIRLDLGELGASTVGADGRVAWEVTTTATGETAELISLEDAHRRRRELNWFELALRLTDDAMIFRTIAPAEFEGHPCWEVQKTTRDGNEERIFLDRDDYLLRGIRMVDTGPLGEYEVTLSFRDWRRVKSLTLFHELVISRNDVDLVIRFDRISLDSIPSQAFARPPVIRELLKAMERELPPDDPQTPSSDSP